jgi:hypothetical protein
MKARAWAWGFVGALALAPAAIGCGSEPQAKFATIKGGEMPEGEVWPGVYYNPVYGYLHIVEQDGAVSGRWKRTDQSHWGELSGTAEGNVLHFTWKEHKYGGVGPSADSHGSGVFVYKPGENKIAELAGQYALDESDKVGEWHCVKQVGMKPDPNQITGDSPADTPATQDKWK